MHGGSNHEAPTRFEGQHPGINRSAVTVALAAQSQDRFTLKSSNGIAFAEFKGYDAWQLIATSQHDGNEGCGTSTDGCAKAILGNPIMIQAYRDGIPANGKPVPDGAAMAKIEWLKGTDEASPYQITVPGAQTEVAFMVKDSKRFKDTNGWGYATLQYDACVEHLQTARRPEQSLVRQGVRRVPHRRREDDRLRLHKLREAVTAMKHHHLASIVIVSASMSIAALTIAAQDAARRHVAERDRAV